MMTDIHHDRLERLLTELAAQFINREASTQSLVTVTRVRLAKDEQTADIFLSVLPEKEERAAVAFVQHHLGDLREYVRKNSDLRSLPRFYAELDYEEKNRQQQGLAS